MATKLSRLDKFYGGIVINDKDKTQGVCLNCEEIDIFTNAGYIQPETVLASNSTDNSNVASGTPRRIWGYTNDNAGNSWALSDDAAGTPKAKIWKIASSASNTSAGNYTAAFTSAQNARTYASNIHWHGTGNPISSAYLYYVTGTNDLYRTEDIIADTTPDSETSVGTLSGLASTSKYCPMISFDGELFIGHGQFVAKVDDTGLFTEKAFTIANGFEIVDMTAIADGLVLLTRSIISGDNTAVVFFWDATSTTGEDKRITLPMGGPQAIINHNEAIRVFCAQNGRLKIFELQGSLPIKTHELDCYNESSMNTDSYVIYPNSVYLKNGILYFGLARGTNNQSGIYALGQTNPYTPLALVLAKRYSSSAAGSGKSHSPFAHLSIGPNVFVSYQDRTSTDADTLLRIEENNSPTRSSTSVLESVLIDTSNPETIKSWKGMFVTAKSIPTSCAITIDIKADNASDYDSNSAKTLNSTNDQQDSGATADRFWFRELTSVQGRAIQVRIKFTSSTTTFPILYTVSIISEDNPLM